MKNEVQVNIKDLILYIIKKWKMLVITGVIGAILVCGLYVLGAKGSFDENHEVIQNRLEALRAALSEEDAKLAEEAAQMYLVNEQQYAYLRTYVAKSLLHKIDTTQTPTYEMVYGMGENEVSQELWDEIALALEGQLKTDAAAEAMQQAVGEEIEAPYLVELVQVKTMENGGNSFMIQVVAPSEVMCQQLAQQVKVQVAAFVEELEAVYSKAEVKLLSESYYVGVNRDVEELQFQLYNRLNNIKTLLGKTYYELTPAQDAYYDELIVQANTTVDVEDGSVDGTAKPVKISKTTCLKMAILGAVVGVILGAVIVFLKYLLTDTLKTKEDISETFKQYVFQNDSMEELIEAVAYSGKKKDVNKLLIVGAAKDEMSTKWKEELQQKLEGRFEKVRVTVADSSNGDFAKLLQEYNGVISVERIGESTYTNIEKEIRLCDFYQVPLLGFVVIK